ncbi:MAG: hypothetical protein NE328_08760 [Lentisphaeraceae bacterium]|nr:hypothetical protein [Lentisphaeraceae bacterium]
MKEHYFFGYLYIKSSKVLAILSIVVGAAVCGSLLFDWKKTVDSSKYESNPALTTSLKKLQQTYNETKKNTFELHSQLGHDNADVKLMPDPSFYDSYVVADHFTELQEQVDNIQKNSNILKDLAYTNFAESADFLLDKMKKYAIMKKWMTPSAEDEGGTPGDESSKPFRLLAVDNVTDLKDKRDGLNEGLQFVNDLMVTAENADSKVKLTSLSNHINAYLSILNAAGINLMSTTDENDPELEQKQRIFKVMEKLNFIKESVRAVVYNNWALDFQYEKTSTLIQEELKKCLDAKETVRKTVSSYGFQLAWTLLAAIITTISILISADLLKAVLIISLRNKV